MNSLVIDATSTKIFLVIINSKNIYTSTHENSKSNFDKLTIFINDFLKNNNSAYVNLLNELVDKSSKLNKLASPYDIVFCHNDFLPANFIENNSKIWVVDWEYAGFNTPLFDLGGLASNNNFTYEQEIYLLENYNQNKAKDEYLSKYFAIKCFFNYCGKTQKKVNINIEQYT